MAGAYLDIWADIRNLHLTFGWRGRESEPRFEGTAIPLRRDPEFLMSSFRCL